MDSNLYMLSAPLGSSAPLSPSAQATLSKHLPKLSSKRLIQQQQPQRQTAEVGCLTELCSSENLPEVEIFSLLEEQIPKYKVRSDFLIDFAGYSNQDWFVPAPALQIPVDGLGLTKEQTRETLNYFLLCGNRVSQMTRAYDDIEAVTRLLEEKEKDLELTVQIGKELLTQNNTLENRINELEADLKSSNDDRAQLIHELHKKNELIAVLTNDEDDGSETDTPTLSKSITLDLMQKKIASLLDVNKSLKTEVSQLADKTDAVEAHERQLMEDISTQLSSANSQFDALSLELERSREENRLQHEQIVSLTARLAEAEMRLHQLTADNDEHMTLLGITKDNQNSLALELVEFKQRYQEVLALLQEAQEQLRRQRKKQMPQARSSFLGGAAGLGVSMLAADSLQSELMESSLYSENSLDSGISGDSVHAQARFGRLMSASASSQLPGMYVGMAGAAASNSAPYKRVFETVRCASKYSGEGASADVSMTQLGAMSMSSSGMGAAGPRMSAMTYGGGSSSSAAATSSSHPAGSFYRNSGGLLRTLSSESLASSQSSDENTYPAAQAAGVPGAPGARDLEAALKRLSPAEVLARRAMLSYAPVGSYHYDDDVPYGGRQQLPLGIRTPDSIMSIGSGSSGIMSSSSCSASTHISGSSATMLQQHHHQQQQQVHPQQWRLPDKLQIVKPMEGSLTLHAWSRLATPTLSGLLEERPGVSVRGGRDLDQLGMQLYTLSDVEEDVCSDSELPPGKQFEAPGCTYTYTTSMVMHPDDGLVTDLSFLSQSQMSSRMASASTSRQPSCPPTPRAGLSRKNSCSTFSVNLGLASMLNERGIKAVTPSALNTPAGPNFTPTVTPCNSPEGSPTRSMSPEPLFGLLSSGADLIKRKLVGGDIERPNRNLQKQKQQQQKIMLSRLERRALRSLKLVEKVESIGLENIIASQPSAMSQLAHGIANRSASPMAQLTSLKHMQQQQQHSSGSSDSGSTNSIVDDCLHFDRQQIKGVLNKGLKSPIAASASSSTLSAAAPPSSSSSAYNSDSDCDGGLHFEAVNRAKTSVKAETEVQATISPPPTLANTSEARAKQMQRQKSRRNLKNGLATQRPDLGTIAGNGAARVRPDLGRVAAAAAAATAAKSEQTSAAAAHRYSRQQKRAPFGAEAQETEKAAREQQQQPQTLTQAFVGSVSSLLFGRKGGWL